MGTEGSGIPYAVDNDIDTLDLPGKYVIPIRGRDGTRGAVVADFGEVPARLTLNEDGDGLTIVLEARVAAVSKGIANLIQRVVAGEDVPGAELRTKPAGQNA